MAQPAIVVIGASAGGVTSLSTLVSGLDPTLDAAIFIVMHIPSHTRSLLPEILSRCTTLPVRTQRSTHECTRPSLETHCRSDDPQADGGARRRW